MEDSVESVGSLGRAAPSVPGAAPAPSLRHSPVSPQRQLVASTPSRSPAAGSDSGARSAEAGLDRKDAWALPHLSRRLEEISREMRRSVEHEFVLAERSLTDQHRSNLEMLQHKAEAAASQKQSIIETLQSEKQQLTRRLELKQRQCKQALDVLRHTRCRLGSRSSLQNSWTRWRAAAVEGKDVRLQDQLAGRLWQVHLTGLLFGSWRRLTHHVWRERLIAHERAAKDAVRSELFEQMELQCGRMSSEVETLKRQLAEEQRQRSLLQDNLKRVFMRGVCALNFEAMTLLAEGATAEQPPGALLTGPPLPAAAALDRPGRPAQEPAEGLGGGANTAVGASGTPVAATAQQQPSEAEASPDEQRQVPGAQAPAMPAVMAPQPDVPQEALQPLPFVSYTGPLDSSEASGQPAFAPPRPPPKGSRWQAAGVPRESIVQPRVGVAG